MTAHNLIQLVPAARISLTLSDGDSPCTVWADGAPQEGSGPKCLCCGQIMRPEPGNPRIVRCASGECSWFHAPWGIGRDAMAPVLEPVKEEAI